MTKWINGPAPERVPTGKVLEVQHRFVDKHQIEVGEEYQDFLGRRWFAIYSNNRLVWMAEVGGNGAAYTWNKDGTADYLDSEHDINFGAGK